MLKTNIMVKKITNKDYQYVNNDLLDILLIDPAKYYEKLQYFKDMFGLEFINKVINMSPYEIYCGNHLHALVMITGNLVYSTSDEKKTIWGINKSLSDSVALKICRRLLEYGVDYQNVIQTCI